MTGSLALGTLQCSNCGEDVDETGYVPALGGGDDREPIPEAALCAACGFSEVGFAGCAPEPGDVDGDALLHVRRVDDGYEVLDAKE